MVLKKTKEQIVWFCNIRQRTSTRKAIEIDLKIEVCEARKPVIGVVEEIAWWKMISTLDKSRS